METFNMIALAVTILSVIIAGVVKKKRPLSEKLTALLSNRKFEIAAVCVILLIGALLRLIALDELPAGMNQDEASMGYDAWSLANYGIDRNGYTFPVYPVAWGAGHGPFYVYLSMLFIKVFGNTLFAYRLPGALLGIASIPILYLTAKKLRDPLTGYLSAFLLAVSPWHIMLSRWGLDSNPLPFLVLLATCFFVIAYKGGKTRWYILSAILYAVSLYAYAAAYIAIPPMLLIMVFFAMKQRRLTTRQLLFSIGAFVLAALPLAVFWIINIFHLPEINTPLFSFPRLTAMRSESVFIPFDSSFLNNVAANLGSLVTLLFSYQNHDIYNVIAGYNIIYVFTFPLMIVGAVRVFRRGFRLKADNGEFIIGAWFLCSVIYALIIHQNINHLSILFIPVIYFTAVGIEWLSGSYRELAAVALCLVMIGSGFFTARYFGAGYRQEIGTAFMKGLGEATVYADSLDCENVYCANINYDPSFNGSYLILCYYCGIDPHQFHDTVEYYDEHTEFRNAKRFGRYYFDIPADPTSAEYNDDVFILPSRDAARFDSSYEITPFNNYIVVRKKG